MTCLRAHPTSNVISTFVTDEQALHAARSMSLR